MARVHTVAGGASSTAKTIAARLADAMVRTVNANDETLEKVIGRVTPDVIGTFTNRELKVGEFQLIKEIASRMAARELSA